ncbi:MAG: oligosaccharide flippase family protein [Candidatus Fermentibacteraceae bacterium]
MKADTTHRELGRETLLYALAMVVSGMVQLAFLPFISRWLTAPQVGELGVLSTVSEVVAAIAILGLPTAVVRAWHESAARRSILLLASVLPLVPLAFCAVLTVIAAPGLLGTLRLTSPGLLLHALALGGAVALFQAASATARARGMAQFFFMLQLCRGLASLGLLLLFMTGFRGVSPLAAFIGARWVPTLAAFGVVVLVMYKHTADSAAILDPGLTRRLLAFGVPLIPAGLAMIVLSGADIVMLRTICPDLSQSGYYEWASRAALILSPITMGFGMAWQRHIFRKKREGGSLNEMGRTALTFMTCVVWASIVLALASREVTLVFGGGSWLPAAAVLPWIAASGALYALFTVSQTGPLLTGQTRFIGGMTFFGAVLNIGFNLRLIPVAGAVGAAFATMAANMFMGMSLFWLGRKVFPVSLGAVLPLMALPVAAGIASGLGPGTRSIIVLVVTAVTVLVLMGLKAAGSGDDKP